LPCNWSEIKTPAQAVNSSYHGSADAQKLVNPLQLSYVLEPQISTVSKLTQFTANDANITRKYKCSDQA